jgi:hypothetical protein
LAKPVKLKDILEAFEYPETWQVYLNKKTGEIFFITDEDELILRLLDEGEEDVDDLPEWQRKALPDLLKNQMALKSGDCIELPSKFDIHEWDIMRRFALSIEDDRHSNQLLHALHGKGAFRYFKDTVHLLGITETWYQFRAHELEEVAVEWLEAKEVPYEREHRSSDQARSRKADR